MVGTGIVETVAEEKPKGTPNYIPRHTVVRLEAKSTKVRIVFDASAKNEKPTII